MKNFGRVIFKIIGGIFTILIVFLTVFFGAFIARTPGEEFDKLLIRLLIGMGIGIIYLIIRFFFPKLLFPSEQQILLNKKKASEKIRMIRSKRGELHSFIKKAYSYYAESFYILYGIFQTLRKYTIFTFTPVFLFVSYIISDTYNHISIMLQIIMLIVFLPFYIVILKYNFIVIKYFVKFVSIFIPESNTKQSTNQYTSSSSSSTSSYYNGGTSWMENDDNYNQVENSEPKEEKPKKNLRVSDLNNVWSSKHGGSLEQAIAEDRNRDVVNFLEDMKREGYPISSNYAVDFVSEVTGRDKNYLLLDSVKRITRVSKDPVALNLIDMRYNELNRQGVGAARNFDRQLIKDAEQRIFGYH